MRPSTFGSRTLNLRPSTIINSVKPTARISTLSASHTFKHANLTATRLGSQASRGFSSSSPSQASYRRFGSPQSSNASNPTKLIPPSLRGSPLILIIIGVGGGYYLVHLQREPHTNRLRFLDVTTNQELQMGEETYRQTLNEYRGRILPKSDSRSQMVERISRRLIASISPEDVKSGTKWEVFVVKDDQNQNAFVVPGGKIFVFTGILPVCKDDDGLATVLSHEIAHQLARHSAEKMSGFKILIAVSFGLQLLGIDPGLSSMAGNLLLSLPNSRKVEMEADFIGLRLMSQACFDPNEAPKFWGRMEAMEGSSSSIGNLVKSVVSTHPVSRKRTENIEKWLPAALEVRSENGCPSSSTMKAFSSFGNRY